MKIRDKETFILFVLGLGLSFFIVINGIQLINAWFTELARGQDTYSYGAMLKIQRDFSEVEDVEDRQEDNRIQYEKARQCLELLTTQEETVYISGIYLPVGKGSVEQSVNVICSGDGQWYRRLQSGSYPTSDKWKESERMAVINEAAKIYTEVVEGQEVIKIDGEDYQVIGVLESSQISDAEAEICIFYKPEPNDTVQSHLAHAFSHGFERYIGIGSMQGDVTETARDLSAELEKVTGYPVSIVEDQGTDNTKQVIVFYARIKGWILGILFFVSLLNCWKITQLWITKKRKDLLIYKTFGFSGGQIFGRVMVELLQMVTLTLLLAACLEIGYLLIFQSGYTDWKMVLRGCGVLLAAFLVTMAVTVIPVMENIRKLAPAQGLREE